MSRAGSVALRNIVKRHGAHFPDQVINVRADLLGQVLQCVNLVTQGRVVCAIFFERVKFQV